MRFCEWLEHTALITAINNSLVLATIVEVLHYFSLFLLVGSILIVDLRLLGLAARRRNAAEVADEMFSLMWAGLVLNFATGFLLFAGDATTFYGNRVFHIKLAVILLAVIVGVIVQWGAARWGRLPAVPSGAKLLAFVSLALWIASILAAVEVPSLTSVG
ncbi:MAG: hypothetical protein LAN59_08030 [Acidobacteriia bacterium]|nr:hypothetical protein [Terriglobia bacterium]